MRQSFKVRRVNGQVQWLHACRKSKELAKETKDIDVYKAISTRV